MNAAVSCIVLVVACFLVVAAIMDGALHGFLLGVSFMICLYNDKKWRLDAEAWARRKFGS